MINRWLTPEQVHLGKEVAKHAAKGYDSDLPYHNWGHILTTVRNSDQIIKKCVSKGVKDIDPFLVLCGDLLHDYDVHKPVAKGISREQRSAGIAGNILGLLDIEPLFINEVQDFIRSTEKGVNCKTTSEKVGVQSDLWNLCGAPYVVLANSYNVYNENVELGLLDPGLHFLDFIPIAYPYLEQCLDKDLDLYDGDLFKTRAMNNLHEIQRMRKFEIIYLLDTAGIFIDPVAS